MTLQQPLRGEPFKGGDAAFAQIGWLGRSGRIYSLADHPRDTEHGGHEPLFTRVGFYVTDESGRTRLED